MPDPTLRFAAGSPDRPFSTIWRLWVHGSDAYLSARAVGHLYKLSMHQSGQWISAFTSQSGAVWESGSRRHQTWTRPSEFTPGWTQGPAVLIPWVEWRGQFQPIEKPPSDTVWVPGPERDNKLVFDILFSAPNVSADEIASVSEPDRSIVGSLPLSDGETVWLRAREAIMSPEEQKGVASAEREFRDAPVSGDLTIDAWALWMPLSPGGIPLLIQFQLGPQTFQTILQSRTFPSPAPVWNDFYFKKVRPR